MPMARSGRRTSSRHFTLDDGTHVLGDDDAPGLAVAGRAAAATQLAELAEAAIDAVEGPLIVVGDLNSTPWSYALRGFDGGAPGSSGRRRNLVTYPLRSAPIGLMPRCRSCRSTM